MTVSDEETVVIGGLIDEIQQDQESKVPWLGDIPILGWLFKSTGDSIQKRNLLVFLTPHIIRNKSQHAQQTIRKREEFWASSEASSQLSDSEREASQQRREEDAAAGIELPDTGDTNPVRSRLESHRKRYPVELMRDLEARAEPASRGRGDAAPAAGAMAASTTAAPAPHERWGVLAATFADEGAAAATLEQLIAAGHDGALVSEEHEGTLLYEVRLGPYPDQAEAERTAAGVRESVPPRADGLRGGAGRVSAATQQLEHLGLREVLLRTTRLSLQQLEEAVRRQDAAGGRLVDHIVELGFLDEEEVLHALGAQLGLPVRRDITAEEIDTELLERLPIAFAKTHAVLPLKRSADGVVRVATSSALDTTVFDDLRLLFDGDEIQTELVTRRAILSLINQVYDRAVGSISGIVEEASTDFAALASEISAEPQDLLEAQDDAPIIRLVDSLSNSPSRSARATSTSSRSRRRSGSASARTTCSTSRSPRCRRRCCRASSRA